MFPVESLVQESFSQFNGHAFSAGFLLALTYWLIGWSGGLLFDLVRKS